MQSERYRSYFPADNAPDRDTDVGFVGVNELHAPQIVEPGYVTFARNTRFTGGVIQPRKGVAKLPWINRSGLADSIAQPFDTIHGVGTYSAPDGLLWNIIAADGGVYRTRQHNAAMPVSLPSGVVLTGSVTFEQALEGLIMFRGREADPLIMASFDAGFRSVTQKPNAITGAGTENATDGTLPIPRAERGTLIGNRLFIPYETEEERDIVIISDFLNVTRYAPVRSAARINQGSNDRLVTVRKFSENAALAFKEASVFLMGNILGDLTQMTLDELIKEYGLCGARTPAMVGSDMWFLAQQRGVVSIRQTEQGKLQGVDLPKSALLDQTMRRVNWGVAKTTATAVFSQNKYYLALPLDDAKGCGPNMLTGKVFDIDGGTEVPVLPGKRYRFTPGAGETLVNDTEEIDSASEFVAAELSVVIAGPASGALGSKLCRVWEDVNNAIVVYDTLQQAWAGYDDGTAMMVADWTFGSYEGAERLMYVGVDGFVNLLDELPADEAAYWTLADEDLCEGLTASAALVSIAVTPGATYRWIRDVRWGQLINGSQTLTESGDFIAQTPTIALYNASWATFPAVDSIIQAHRWELVEEWVDQEWITRAYGGQAIGRKKWSDLEMHVETWFPSYRVTCSTEGNRGEAQIVPKSGQWATRSNQVYDWPWNAPTWDITNANDDHGKPHRQDYSVVLDDDDVDAYGILPGLTYFVESRDVETPCSIVYNGSTYTNQTTFVGVPGQSSWSVTVGDPVVYAPGSYVLLGDNGINFSRTQEDVQELRVPPSCRGRGVQIRFRCNQGFVGVKGLAPSGTFSTRAKGVRN